MPEIHVATAMNRNYLLPLAVLLHSIKGSVGEGRTPVIHLLHRDLETADIDRLGTLLDVHPIRVGDEMFKYSMSSSVFPAEASFPLLLAELLPSDLERVLFLDADTMVMDDIGRLWDIPLEGHVLAAVQDAAVLLCSSPRGVKGWRALGIPEDALYFNGGVMSINLPLWREQNVTRKAHRYLELNKGHVDFLHQEALNAVLWDNYLKLDVRWNLPGSRAGRRFDPFRDQWEGDPGIVHFSGRMKPWLFPIGGSFYQSYRAAMASVSSLFPPPDPTREGWLKSQYDRLLRDFLYPIESYLWRRRWI